MLGLQHLRTGQRAGTAQTLRPAWFVTGTWLVTLLGVLNCLYHTHAADLTVLTNAAQVLNLSRERPQEQTAVQLRGIVTFSDPIWRVAYVQDATAGMAVQLGDEPCPLPGDIVEVRGVSDLSSFAPTIVKSKIAVLGRAPLPPFRDKGAFLRPE